MKTYALCALLASCSSPSLAPAIEPMPGLKLHVEPYVLAPGAESVECRVLRADGPALHVAGYLADEQFGMHHMTLYVSPPGAADPCAGALSPLFLVQRAHETADFSGGAPEYAGATLEVPAGSLVAKVHALNSTPDPVTIEAWITLDTRDAAPMPVSLISLSAGNEKMAVPPHSKQTYKASTVAPADMIVVQLVGHTHAHTTEQRASVGTRNVYDATDWSEPAPVWFTSKTSPLVVTKGQTIAWECDIDNTTDAVLGYAERVQTAEMCNLTGFVVGPAPWLASAP